MNLRIHMIAWLCIATISVVAADSNNTDFPKGSKSNTTERESTNGSEKKISPLKSEYVVYNYTGKLGYNSSCMSDEMKENLLHSQRQLQMNLTLKEELDSTSCDITKFLECRQVNAKQLKAGDKTRNVLFSHPNEVDPDWRCTCPDYEKIATVHPNAYFDHSRDHCVLKVRSKCSSFEIPQGGRRFNGTSVKKPADGRIQPTSLPCAKNAKCHQVDESIESDDINQNRCVCEDGSFPGDDNLCYKIEDDTFSPPYISGLLLLAFAFALFFGVTLCGGGFEYKRYGSQDEVIILGPQFGKQLLQKEKQ